MTRTDAADIFAPRHDAEWEMFCRGSGGGAAGAPPAVELAPPDDSNATADAPAAAVCHFSTRIVGLPYPNPDGTSRREAVRALKRWDLVQLVHRPDNPVDANAVAVLRAGDGRQLGFLPAATAKDVVTAARDHGTRYLALVSDVSGGDPDDLVSVAPVTADLLVLLLEGGATRAMARQYLLRRMNGGPGA